MTENSSLFHVAGSWTGRRVLVTGATGFLGGHVVSRLIEYGAHVHATVRPGRPGGRADVQWLPLDLSNVDALYAAVGALHPDMVIHLGGRVSAAVDPALVGPTFHTLLGSSVALLSAAQSGYIGRLVLIGSTDEPRSGAFPTSPYGAAKAAMTSYAQLCATAFATPVVGVRPAEAFGPGQAPSKLLPYVAASVLEGVVPRLSSGRRRGDWVYVDDVVDGMLLAALGAPDGADLDLGTGKLRSNREMVEGLLRVLGTDVVPEWGALPDRPNEQERAADVEHTAQVLRWRSRVPLEEGLRRTAAAARVEGARR